MANVNVLRRENQKEDQFTFPGRKKRTLFFICLSIIAVVLNIFRLASSHGDVSANAPIRPNVLPMVVPRVESMRKIRVESIRKNGVESIRKNRHSNNDNAVQGTKPSPRGSIVIAMGFCCSKKSQQLDEKEVLSIGVQHRHGKKAYDVAALLSARLWLQQDPSLKVLILLAYTNTTESKAEMQRMTELVEMAGAIPWPYSVAWSSNPDKACVRAGQMARMFAHESGLFKDNDFVITADVDIFPVNVTRMLAPVRETNKEGNFYKVWLGTYQWTFHGGARNAGTIALGQVGQSQADWRHAMQASDLDLKKAIDIAVNATEYSWGVDQSILTVALMNDQLCWFPPDYGFWTQQHIPLPYKVSRNHTFDDSQSCLKNNAGHYDKLKGAECLQRFHPNNLKCTWVHFLPSVTEGQMVETYDTIGGMYPNHRKGVPVH
jgi:hypothetical protein